MTFSSRIHVRRMAFPAICGSVGQFFYSLLLSYLSHVYHDRTDGRAIRFRCGFQNTILDVLKSRSGWQESTRFVAINNILTDPFSYRVIIIHHQTTKCLSIDQSINQLINKSAYSLINQSNFQSISQSVNHSISQ